MQSNLETWIKNTPASTTIDECREKPEWVHWYSFEHVSYLEMFWLSVCRAYSCPQFLHEIVYRYLIKVTCYTQQSYDIQQDPANYWVLMQSRMQSSPFAAVIVVKIFIMT